MPKPQEHHLPATLEASHEMIGDLLGEMRKMQSQIEWLRRKVFGRSSERLAEGEPDFFGQPFTPEANANDNSALGGPAPADEATQAPDASPKDAAAPKSRRRSPLDDLPRQVIVHDVAEADKTCACCGREKKSFGQDSTEQMEFIPASLFIIQHVRPKYACPKCHEGVAQAPMPPMPIERGAVGAGPFGPHHYQQVYGSSTPLPPGIHP